MSTYQEIERQIKTLQEEHRKHIQQLQEQAYYLRREEHKTALPESFNRESAINFLNNPNSDDLFDAFLWDTSSEGLEYWFSISKLGPHGIPEEAVIQLQKWVIESYQQQYGV